MKESLSYPHLFYWWMTDFSKLGDTTAQKLREADVAVSAATLWEMLLKHRKGKLPLPDEPLHQAVAAQGFRLLPIGSTHLEALRGFVLPHEDPFDRLLLATAIAEQITFLTRDGPILSFGLSFVEPG
jgi:PIN domain nuclease of toxin-antitoxin system